ncbi:MAG TPA: glycosyltransferase [Vicinamibacterales bacterium]|nr:glycosyltransferase [Vicinamibacterales bacterium]
MLVSILIPCFNARQWVAQAIDSALAQSWPHKEVIVVDDGSTDGSDEVIRDFGARIISHRQSNQGSNPTRNRLLALASGEWLQYLDADDYLLPRKIQGQVSSVDLDSGVDVVFGPVLLEHVTKTGAQRELLPIPEPHDPWVLLARWYLPQTGAPLWRKAALENVGGWSPDQAACQEHDLYLRLLMAGKKFVYLDANGAVYRQWSEETLWKKDQPRTRRLRLEIEDRMEAFLRDRGELTAQRHWAINMARFEMARMAWQHDREEALAIMRTIKRSGAAFVPAGNAAPASYQLIYRLMGFAAAESAADWRRRLRAVVGGR